MILTYRFRLKDQNKRNLLKGFAGQVNLVWNTCNEVIRENWRRSRKYTIDILPTAKAGGFTLGFDNIRSDILRRRSRNLRPLWGGRSKLLKQQRIKRLRSLLASYS